jgi:hypothetical protein
MLKEKLEKIRDEKAEGFILGATLSPHQKDIFCEGFDYCQSELLPLIEEMRGALEFYSAKEYWSSCLSNGGIFDEQDGDHVECFYNPDLNGEDQGSRAREVIVKLQEYETQQGEKKE